MATHGTRVQIKGGEFHSKTKVSKEEPGQPKGIKVQIVETNEVREDQGGGSTTVRTKGLGTGRNRPRGGSSTPAGVTKVAILEGPKGRVQHEYLANEIQDPSELPDGPDHEAPTTDDDTIASAALQSVREAEEREAGAHAAAAAAEAREKAAQGELAELRQQLADSKAAHKPSSPPPSED